MTSPTPAPPIPSTSDLAALDPAVAITFLAVVALGIIGFYLGPVLRERLRVRPADPAPTQPMPGAHALRPTPDPPVEVAAAASQQFIDHLLRQVEQAGDRIDELEARLTAKDREVELRLAAKDREIDALQQQIRRLESLLSRGRPG